MESNITIDLNTSSSEPNFRKAHDPVRNGTWVYEEDPDGDWKEQWKKTKSYQQKIGDNISFSGAEVLSLKTHSGYSDVNLITVLLYDCGENEFVVTVKTKVARKAFGSSVEDDKTYRAMAEHHRKTVRETKKAITIKKPDKL